MQESQEEPFEDSHPGTHSSTQWHHSVDLAHSAGGSAACLQDTTKVRKCTASIFPCSQVCAQVRCTQHKQATCQPSLCARPSNSPALTKLGVMGLLGTWEKRQKPWLMGNPVSHQAI